MQNRYTGDIGDFSKLGLLRALSNAGFTIGLNWYLTPNETHNEDGKHTKYLCQAEKYRFLDPQLFDELKEIIDSGSREVSAMEKPEILEAKFFSEILDFPISSTIREVRRDWHSRALQEMKGKDIVCLDPDNGLIVPYATGTRRENKYVLREELQDYYQLGSSVIYYQHKARRKDEYYREQISSQMRDFQDAAGLMLKFRTTSQRYYMFILQPQHKDIVKETICTMLEKGWKNHFRLYEDLVFISRL